MAVKYLVLLSLLLASVGVLEAAQSCAPSCLGVVQETKVKVPWDCTKYAVCLDIHGNGELWPSEPTSCPDEQYFDDTGSTPECADIQGANAGFCQNTCNPCELLWGGIGETTPDPDNCNTYYVGVAGGQTVAVHCDQEGFPYYNYVDGSCSANEAVCFTSCDHCQPYCIGTGNIPDPKECNAFYYCAPPEITHAYCPTGESFDSASLQCLAGAECVAACSYEH